MSKIEEVAVIMEEIISGNQTTIMEKMWRSGKGELFILKYLCAQNSAITPSEISDAMNTSTARISAALGSLEKKEQIRREIDLTNRRNILVTVTEEGRNRAYTDKKQLREILVSVFTQMGELNAILLVSLLKQFSEIANQNLESQQ